jgi:hypothetical protein
VNAKPRASTGSRTLVVQSVVATQVELCRPYIVTYFGVCDYRRALDLIIGFIALTHSTLNYRQYSAIADLHTLQFTVTRALGFSVFTSRILATDFNTVFILVSL